MFIFIVGEICNRCGNINKNISYQNLTSLSSSNLPFVISFENNFIPFGNNINNNSNGLKSNYINSTNNGQNEQYLFSKNNKKNKKVKKLNNQKHKEKRPFDWVCNRCNNLNYSFRIFCNICNLPRNENQFYTSNIRNSS
jgi:hypothetical protein